MKKEFNLKRVLFAGVIVFSFVINGSCQEKKLHKYLVGGWTIEYFNYKGYNIKKCLLVNALSFHEDNSLYLPAAPDYRCSKFVDNVHTGTFTTEEISKDSAIINFNTENHFFSGKHLLVKKDSSAYTIVIKSDSLYILLAKEGY